MLIRFPPGVTAESWSGTRKTTRSLLRRFLSSVTLVEVSGWDLPMFSGMVFTSFVAECDLVYLVITSILTSKTNMTILLCYNKRLNTNV